MIARLLKSADQKAVNDLAPRYIVDSVFKDLLLRSPENSEITFWSDFVKNNGVVELVNFIQNTPEKTALNKIIESKRTLFMHIPKTAGTSFATFFKRFTNKIYNFAANDDSIFLTDAVLVTGHFGFATIKETTFTHSFTILRDPIERIISLYRYGRSQSSGWHIDDPVRTLDFDQWISSNLPIVRTQIDSFYVRVITDDIVKPFENRIAESVALALKRYSAFSAVGDHSDLNLFCLKISSLFNLPFFSLPNLNGTNYHIQLLGNYPPRPKLTPEVQDRLGQLTRLDYEVYNRFRAK
jgi:hypothetical protein